MNELGCFDTHNPLSNLLVDQLQMLQPEQILDLGSGQGSLLQAAYHRWPQSLIHAAEIDPHRYERMRVSVPNIRAIRADGLDHRLNLHLQIDEGSIDVAVCNPPYRRFTANADHQSVLNAAGLNCQFCVITTDLLFLAQNLRLLRTGGELGIILPDGLLTGKNFADLRKVLLEQHEIFGVIQLPDKAFSHTEARTHILLLRKGQKSPASISLHRADFDGSIVSSIHIAKADAITRMDHDYWCWHSLSTHMSGHTLVELNGDIRRGLQSRNEYQSKGITCFHTTDFPVIRGQLVNLVNKKIPIRDVVAQPGDILLARVGKRCIGRVTQVKSGQMVLSDCVYRIRLPKPWQAAAFKAFCSDTGQSWLQAHAHGVCAQVISKVDLLGFTVPKGIGSM